MTTTKKSAPKTSTPKPTSSVSLGGLSAVSEDARLATLATDHGPPDPTDYNSLMARLQTVEDKFPPLYQESFVGPYVATLKALGANKFATILKKDPNREGPAGLLFDLAQAVLQHGEGYNKAATRAYQEFISDLYDGYLGSESRHGVKQPDLSVIPPLVKWGNPDSGPYTWPVDAASSFHVKTGVVNLPPANASQGLVAWAALGHETAGHDILHADTGLLDELSAALQENLAPLGLGLADYFSNRIDETASDVQGILNLGPAAGIGLIAYFRGLIGAYSGKAKLRNEGPADDPHPADIVRGFLAAEVVALLNFSGRKAWSAVIASETEKDLGTIVLADQVIPATTAKKAAKIVAHSLVATKLNAIENHSLGQIQNWQDGDEALVQSLRAPLRDGTAIDFGGSFGTIYAAHLVAAAVTEALATGHDLAGLQERMIQGMVTLHEKNPVWGPLYVAHPGDMIRNYVVAPGWRR